MPPGINRMGIHGLAKVIADHAPKAIKENVIGQYFGRKVAIDASMSIYQFLIAVRMESANSNNVAGGAVLTNDAGETTSHLMGIFYRTIRMMEHGIKPVYVFDGAPPPLKSGELDRRLERRQAAERSAEEAREAGSTAQLDKFNRRTVKVTREHCRECQQLLSLMGVPWLEAPGEAEAQCATLARTGLVYAAGSEDMDTLTFASPVLLRHLTFSEARKMPITEIHLEAVLGGLGLSMDQFIDFCILLGCDYCDSIRGIGPTRALALIRQWGSIEAILENLDRERYQVPPEWPYKEARELFRSPNVLMPDAAVSVDGPSVTERLKWEGPNVEGLLKFMVQEKGFNEKRIQGGIDKLLKQRTVATQGRLDGFFKVTTASDKRKVDAVKATRSAKKTKK